jgi:hypothetical protein
MGASPLRATETIIGRCHGLIPDASRDTLLRLRSKMNL